MTRLKPGVVFFSVVAHMFAPSVGTTMDGEHAFATSDGTAWRPRQRRPRAFRRFVLSSSKMEVAASLHHTARLLTATAAAATQTMNYIPAPAAATYSAAAMSTSALIQYVAPAPVIADFLQPPVPVESAPVSEYAATLAATALLSTPVPVIEHVMPASTLSLHL